MSRTFEIGKGAATSFVFFGLILAGIVDYVSGVEIRAYPLYFLPVCLAAWYFTVIVSGFVVLAATAIWVASNVAAGLQYSQDYIIAINACAQFITFAVVATLLNYSRVLLNREKLLSNTDRTTGLLNSRGFYPLVAFAIASCKRRGVPLAFAYIDLDNFKCVNDKYGHQRGDVLLNDVAALLKKALRESDVVGRLGGDEFAVCLPDTDRAQAAHILERLRLAISEVFPSTECKVSASIGAVCWDIPPDEIEAMVSDADNAMYRVKAAGKNRVEIHSIPSGK